ncbi:MAG: Clp protease ClpP [Rikenellaceae bacterium]
MQNIKIMNALDLCVIDIEGVIGVAEEWQFEDAGTRVATYEKFRESVAQIEALEAQSVVVNIRSTGGDVGDAMLIYEALCSLNIPITTRCYGYVASAATVIAQAASQGCRQISANALYLVHNSTCMAEGNAIELSSRVDLLVKTDERLAELYARRSGKETEEFAALMAEDSGNGRWLTAQETIEAGLADALIDNTAREDDDNSSIKNFWRKLGAKLGLSAAAESPEELALQEVGHSVLHSQDQQIQDQQDVRIFAENQAAAVPTTLMQVEDPTLMDVTPTKNQKAYAADIQAFRG